MSNLIRSDHEGGPCDEAGVRNLVARQSGRLRPVRAVVGCRGLENICRVDPTGRSDGSKENDRLGGIVIEKRKLRSIRRISRLHAGLRPPPRRGSDASTTGMGGKGAEGGEVRLGDLREDRERAVGFARGRRPANPG